LLKLAGMVDHRAARASDKLLLKTARSPGIGIGSWPASASMSAVDVAIYTYTSALATTWGRDRRQPLKLADTVKNQRHTVEGLRSEAARAHRQVPHPAVT
jgi:hypothetical protein